MRTVEVYRQRAVECRALASRARTSEEREMILKMAETWEELAAGRAKMLRSRARAKVTETATLEGKPPKEEAV